MSRIRACWWAPSSRRAWPTRSVLVAAALAFALLAVGVRSLADGLAASAGRVPVVAAVTPSGEVLFLTTSGRVLARPALRVGTLGNIALSPDGKTLAFSGVGSGAFDVETVAVAGGEPIVVAPGTDPAWSPDGQEMAFALSLAEQAAWQGQTSLPNGSNLFTIQPGGGVPQLFLASRYWDEQPSWSPDGRQLVFTRLGAGGGIAVDSGIYVTDGTTVRRLVSDKDGVASEPAWSPNGKQIAFVSDRHGGPSLIGRTEDIYLINADGTGLRRLTHDPALDEQEPRWSADGAQLAFEVATAGGERAGVAVMPVSGGKPCLLYVTWGGLGGVDWEPQSRPGSRQPSRCLSLTPPRPAPILRCTRAGADSAVDRSNLPLSLKAYAHGYGAIDSSCVDFTHDGRPDLIVLFDGKGSGGVLAWAAFQRTQHEWKLVLVRTGGRITVTSVEGDLVETQPIYRPHDSGCCPTGGVAHRQYHWNGSRLILRRAWQTRS